jgi:quercetin dioxygenase-like cupin family protein
MRVRICPVLLLLIALFPFPASAQSQPASTVRTLLAAGRVGIVVDTPLSFRLLSVRLPAAQRVSYSGPNAMIYAPAGRLGFELDGNAQPLNEGAGAFIPAGRTAAFTASGPEPANFLLFVLSPAADVEKPLLGAPAAVEELYRSPEPLPGLQAGPHEFSLTRVALPSGMPMNPPHYRSGAALYYIAAGEGMFSVDGKTEPRRAGMAHFEPHGLVHRWANPGAAPLVLIQANISQEGVPAVIAAGTN